MKVAFFTLLVFFTGCKGSGLQQDTVRENQPAANIERARSSVLDWPDRVDAAKHLRHEDLVALRSFLMERVPGAHDRKAADDVIVLGAIGDAGTAKQLRVMVDALEDTGKFRAVVLNAIMEIELRQTESK